MLEILSKFYVDNRATNMFAVGRPAKKFVALFTINCFKIRIVGRAQYNSRKLVALKNC